VHVRRASLATLDALFPADSPAVPNWRRFGGTVVKKLWQERLHDLGGL